MTPHSGGSPLLPLVEAPTDARVRALFETLAAGNGLLNLHRMMAHAPALLQASVAMAQAFRRDATLARPLAEIVVPRIAQLFECDYVWRRHLPLARAAGTTEQQIEELARWPDSAAFTPAQKAALGFAEQATRGAAVEPAVFATLRRALSPREVVELTMLVGYYVSTVIFIKTLAVPADEA
jgi:4-carboxymuconolactone decarboxylase